MEYLIIIVCIYGIVVTFNIAIRLFSIDDE